jgi:hypothetical protein
MKAETDEPEVTLARSGIDPHFINPVNFVRLRHRPQSNLRGDFSAHETHRMVNWHRV